MAALAVDNLTKRYNKYLAVAGISFSVAEGEVLGLLGPNGAGKSTTMQMLLGLTEPDAGHISYFGRSFADEREWCLSQINFASTYAEMNARMTVYQSLHIFAELYQVPNPHQRIRELGELLECSDLFQKQFWHLSSGQKTRIILAKALINKPRMLLMDEPTASLDPDIVDKFIEIIHDLRQKEQLTILYTSHNMEEVARLCDRVAFLVQGRIMVIDTPLELTRRLGNATLRLGVRGERKVIETYLEKVDLKFKFERPDLLDITIAEADIPKVIFDLKKLKIWILTINVIQPSLEDVFLHISRNETL
jgi:ABC-2 type transport system ATP-binding protein